MAAVEPSITSDSRMAKRQKTDPQGMLRGILQQRKASLQLNDELAIANSEPAPLTSSSTRPYSRPQQQHFRQQQRRPQHTLDVGISTLQGNRQYQEDAYALMSTQRLSMVAVYDGHGGALTSQALQQHLLSALRDALEPVLERNSGIQTVCAAIRDTFLQVNTSLCTGDKDVVSDGSTAAVLVICKVDGRLLAISANAGDSRITLGAAAANNSSETATRKLRGTRSHLSQAPANRPGQVNVAHLDSGDDASSEPDGSSSDDSQIECPSDAEPDSPLRDDVTTSGDGGNGGGKQQRSSFAVRLSCDHDLEHNKEEVARIRAAGGVLVRFQRNGPLRVLSHAGGLNMSRSFGDVAYNGLVIAEPFISVTAIEQPAEFIVIATDGLWGVMEDEEAVAYVHALFHYKRPALSSGLSAKRRQGKGEQRVAPPDADDSALAPSPSGGAAAAGAAMETRPPVSPGLLQRLGQHRDGNSRSSQRTMAGATGFSARQAANLLQREAARRWAARCPGQQDNTTVAVLRFCWSPPASPPVPAPASPSVESDIRPTLSAPL